MHVYADIRFGRDGVFHQIKGAAHFCAVAGGPAPGPYVGQWSRGVVQSGISKQAVVLCHIPHHCCKD